SKPLPDQTVPAMEQSLHGFMPLIERTEQGEYIYSAVAQTEQAQKALAHADKAIADQESAAEDSKGKPAPKKDVLGTPPQQKEHTKLEGKRRLHQDRPKPAPQPALSEEQQQTVGATMGSVAAMVMADLRNVVNQVVDSGRAAAYPNVALARHASKF